jgi:hypothetical protein
MHFSTVSWKAALRPWYVRLFVAILGVALAVFVASSSAAESKKSDASAKGHTTAKPATHSMAKEAHHPAAKVAVHHAVVRVHRPGVHPMRVVGRHARIMRVGVARIGIRIHLAKHYRVIHLGRWHRPHWAPRVVGSVLVVRPLPYRILLAPVVLIP